MTYVLRRGTGRRRSRRRLGPGGYCSTPSKVRHPTHFPTLHPRLLTLGQERTHGVSVYPIIRRSVSLTLSLSLSLSLSEPWSLELDGTP